MLGRHSSARRLLRGPVVGLGLGLGLSAVALGALHGTALAAPPAKAGSAPAAATPSFSVSARAAAPAASAAASRLARAGLAVAGARHAAATVAPADGTGATLHTGDALAPGDALTSPSGRWSLVMDESGALLLQKAANALDPVPYATTVVAGRAGSTLRLQADGNLVLYGPTGVAEFETRTAGQSAEAEDLVMQDDGNVVLYGVDGAVRYSFNTAEPQGLVPGGSLLPGEALRSGDTVLAMQSDGNLVLSTAGVVRFATATSVPGAGAVLQPDGNFVVYSPQGQPLFSAGSGGPTSTVLLVSDREFRVLSLVVDHEGQGIGEVVSFGSSWSSAVVEPGLVMIPGDRRTAPGGVQLVLQSDGNLVEYVAGKARFATGTDDADVAFMQPDGNFVLYAQEQSEDSFDLVPVFETRTSGFPGSRLVVQADANVVIYTPTGRAVYAAQR